MDINQFLQTQKTARVTNKFNLTKDKGFPKDYDVTNITTINLGATKYIQLFARDTYQRIWVVNFFETVASFELDFGNKYFAYNLYEAYIKNRTWTYENILNNTNSSAFN